MENLFTFYFEGKPRRAELHISLQKDGCFLFTILQDEELISRYGKDIDLETDTERVIQKRVTNERLLTLQTAILEAAKNLPEFHFQKATLKKSSK